MTVDVIVYHNHWRNVDVPEVSDCFELVNPNEIKAGDLLWINTELYPQGGKVYGYKQVTVEGIRKKGDQLSISYGGSVTIGTVQLQSARFHRLTKPDQLTALVEQHGNRITHVHDPGQDAAIEQARARFEETFSKLLPRK